MPSLLLMALASAGPCDPAGVDALIRALGSVPSEYRVELAAMGFAEACPDAGVASGAAMLAQLPPRDRPLMDARSVIDSPATWIAVCAEGLAVPKRMIEAAEPDKRGVVWNGCGLAERGWFTEAEWDAADGTVFLALSAGQTLQEAGVAADPTRKIVRALAGIGGSGPRRSLHDELREPELIEPVEILAPMDPRLGGPGVELSAPEAVPGFAQRPEIRWSRAAQKSGERSCELAITVRKTGVLGRVEWTDCAEVLRKDVEKALGKAEYTVATEGGEPVRGTFITRFAVR